MGGASHHGDEPAARAAARRARPPRPTPCLVWPCGRLKPAPRAAGDLGRAGTR
jgi:hypothetical protein